MTLDSLEFNRRDKTIHIGIDCYGQGPTILMFPALSSISTRSEMRPLGEQLASSFTTIAIDWLGLGDRPRPSVAWEPDAYRTFLAKILQELPSPTATVAAGHAAGYLLCHPAENPGSAGGSTGVTIPPAAGNTQASSSNLKVVPEVDVAADDMSIVVHVAALGSSFVTVRSKGPMTPEDLSLLESALQEIEKLNCDFLSMAAARGELMIQDELKTNIGIDPNNGGASSVH